MPTDRKLGELFGVSHNGTRTTRPTCDVDLANAVVAPERPMGGARRGGGRAWQGACGSDCLRSWHRGDRHPRHGGNRPLPRSPKGLPNAQPIHRRGALGTLKPAAGGPAFGTPSSATRSTPTGASSSQPRRAPRLAPNAPKADIVPKSPKRRSATCVSTTSSIASPAS